MMTKIDVFSYEHHPVEDIEPQVEESSTPEAELLFYHLQEILKWVDSKSKLDILLHAYNSILRVCCDDLTSSEVKQVRGYIECHSLDVCLHPDSLMIVNWALAWIYNSTNRRVAAWQVAYAVGLKQCSVSMTVKGSELGVGYAAISKGARDFCEAHDLPPSRWMRSQEFVDKRREHETYKN